MGRSHRTPVPRCAIGLWLVALLACSDEPGAAGGASGTEAGASGGSGGATSAAGAPSGGTSGTAGAGAESDDPSRTTTAAAGTSGGALPFCQGAPAAATGQKTCHDDGECGAAGTARCQVPWPATSPCGAPSGCACPPAKLIHCANHEECGTGRCHTEGPFGVGCSTNFCMPSCMETGCGDGFTCDDDRLCAAIACDAGFACPDGTQCARGAPGADVHGCEPLRCDQGYACRDGYVCRPDDPRAVQGSYGCVIVRCDEAGGPECEVNHDCVADAPGTGCTPRPCERDAQCDCGACVNGACAMRTGLCMTFAATGG